VPVPVEQQAETQRETLQVRELLDEGNRLTREGLYDEASAVFEEALRLYPEYSQARFNLGVSRVRQGRPDLAAEHFRIFLESDPFNPMADKARELLGGISRPAEGGDL
jgi:tetratricopeptide (TPR) repeat protein